MPPEAAVAPAAPAAPAVKSSPLPEIHVTEAGMTRGPATDRGPAPEPPKPGSARSRMFDDLRKKANVESEPKPEPKPKSETPAPDDTTTDTITDETPASAEESAPAAEPVKKGKVSPWKLVDEHKAARLKAETENAELRKAMVDPAKVKEIETKAEAAEKRAKELEDHIRFVDYSKSAEFQEKYQKPYEQAWQRWMGELGELTVADESGNERPLAPKDLLEVVSMDMKSARALAVEKYGDFADDVMSARKEIRGLFQSQQNALEEAKKMTASRMEEMQKARQIQQETLKKEITTTWQEANKAAVADEQYGKFFKPVDGDEEGNQRLQKGYEMADKAFSANPNDPRLTPDQRSEIVKLHAAIRNRAAGFGRLAFQNQKLEAKIKALSDELGKYKTAQPGAGEPHRNSGQGQASAKDSVFSALHKLAR